MWYDNDNNSLIDYGEGETGVSGVVVNLYRDTDGNGTVEPLGADSTPFRTATTSSTVGDEGYYRFDMLPVGQYIVGIPANQFASSAVLDGYISSNYLTEPDPDANASDTDDSGRDASTPANPIVDGVYSLPVTIGLDGSGLPEQDPNSFEPTGETDEPTSYPASAVDTDALASATDRPEDKRENLTVDFGFFRPLSLGNRVWIDYNGDGDIDTGEPGVDGVTVNLLLSDGTTAYTNSASVAYTVVTANGGYYRFDNLTPGDYIVQIPQAEFLAG